MSKRAWYRSLYWRIGAGFVLFLALIAAVQAGALVWLTSRVQYGPPSPSATRVVADELSIALTENPKLDLAEFFKQHYEERIPMVAVMRDGRVVSSNGVAPPEDLLAEARARVSAGAGRGFGGGPPRFRGGGPGGGAPRGGGQGDAGGGGAFGPPEGGDPGSGGRGGPGGPGGPGGLAFGGGRRGGLMARGGPWSPIVVNGQLVGDIVANPQSTWQQFGPTLLVVGFALVALGTTSAALLIFGPVRSRLQSLETAARRVGAGDLTARAREDGGDEVAELATAFNQMTGDLSARAEQLAAADRQRRMLFADVSHELMTPLTAMRGYLETLAMSGITIDAPTRSRYLSIIGDETQRMEHIVGDLLELARLEGARESPEKNDKQDVTLEDLFGRVMARHERDAEQNQIELTTLIEPGAEIVQGDPMRLEQALQNLAANALRHTPPGGRVELRAEAHEQHVVIKVRDTGTGIAPEHLPHVFDRFYKVDPSRSGEKPGSGLGLSIVKAIIERHGGTVSVTSEPHQSTEFTIRLPL
jgi:signal transduction histidine kinase